MRSAYILLAFINAEEEKKEIALAMIDKADKFTNTIPKQNNLSLAKALVFRTF
jgi:hypothetical protein